MDNKTFILDKINEDKYNKCLSQFKVGDMVRICRKIESYSEGWDNFWVDEMDAYLNVFGMITSISMFNRGVKIGAMEYNFPPQALEKI